MANRKTIQHPLFGISFKNWLKILEENGGVDRNYIDRGTFVTLASIFLSPARFLSNLRYGKRIENYEIDKPPIIIIGHWRSGTTYLHELLSQDPQFCYVSLWNTMIPNGFITLEPTKNFLSRFLPKKRPMDEIRVQADGPYEEEAAIAVFFPWSFFHCLHFPKNAEEQYLKSIHFQGLSSEEIEEWKKRYLNFMKSVVFSNNGKRLLLKNPANTTRIKTLLEIFPNARFVHIYRNPYKVYFSTVKMRNNVLEKLALQNGSKVEIEKQVINNYKRVMKTFFEQKKLIPKDRYVEVKYEDLVKNPVKQVKNIYSKLDLTGIKNAMPGVHRYLEDKKDYKTNVYKIDKKVLDHIYKNWRFTIDKWGYNPP